MFQKERPPASQGEALELPGGMKAHEPEKPEESVSQQLLVTWDRFLRWLDCVSLNVLAMEGTGIYLGCARSFGTLNRLRPAIPSPAQCAESSPAVPSPASSLEDSKRGGKGRKGEEEPKGKGDRGEVRSALPNWVRKDGLL